MLHLLTCFATRSFKRTIRVAINYICSSLNTRTVNQASRIILQLEDVGNREVCSKKTISPMYCQIGGRIHNE